MDDTALFGRYPGVHSAACGFRQDGSINRAGAPDQRFLRQQWKSLRQQTGGVTPGKIGGQKKRTLSGAHAEWLRQRIRSGPLTLRKLTAELAERGVKTDVRAVWTFVHAESLSFKKTMRAAPSRIVPISLVSGHPGKLTRAGSMPPAWSSSMRPGSRPTWPRYAAGDRAAQRLAASAPFGHWKTMTFIAALRCDRISAPWVIDGPINGELFTRYVEKELAPTLAQADVVILDNLGSHKGKRARDIIRAKRAHLLFLPPYSPDLNPIEQAFAKLKHLMRAAERRTIDATWRKSGDLLDLFSAKECANYLKNSGYVSV